MVADNFKCIKIQPQTSDVMIKYKKNMRHFLIFSLILIASGCSHRPMGNRMTYHQEEFFKDSLLINQGKKGIAKLLNFEWEKASFETRQEIKVSNGDIFSIYIYNLFPHPWIDALKTLSDSNQLVCIEDKLTIPYLGTITIQGLTLEQVKEKILSLIAHEFPEASAAILLKDRLFNRVEIAGIINSSFPILEKNQTLYQILSMLNFPKEVSLYNSYLKRDGKVLKVDFEKLMIDHQPDEDIPLKHGDFIYIADWRRANVMVLGEVRKVGVVPMDQSKISLKEVIAKSGGLELSADRTFIQIIRGGMSQPKIYTLNYGRILTAPNDALLLMQGDILYVAATPIAEWNRLINQLLPTITAYEFFHRGIQGVIIP